MEAKVAKLQAATIEAEQDVRKHLELVDDATKRLQAAKALLKQIDPDEQEKIMVNDTNLPELLDLLARATHEYESSLNRYETNKKYLALLKAKIGKAKRDSVQTMKNEKM